MSKDSFLQTIKKNYQKRSPGYISRFSVKDRPVHCPHCAGDEFSLDRALLNKWFSTLFGFDFADRNAKLLLCQGCGYIVWFSNRTNIIERQ